jgi:hypothetical protein
MFLTSLRWLNGIEVDDVCLLSTLSMKVVMIPRAGYLTSTTTQISASLRFSLSVKDKDSIVYVLSSHEDIIEIPHSNRFKIALVLSH